MRIYDRYLISLAITFGIVNSILAFVGQKKLDVYFTINLIAYLVISLLFVYLNPRARGLLSAVGIVLFGGFLVIVALKVIEILSR